MFLSVQDGISRVDDFAVELRQGNFLKIECFEPVTAVRSLISGDEMRRDGDGGRAIAARRRLDME